MKWYEDQLARMFGPLATSPAMVVRIEQTFKAIHQQKMQQEPTVSWQIPLKFVLRDDSSYGVELAEPDEILFLDDLYNDEP